MIFGRRIKHKLPRFPEGVASTFRALCEVIPAEDLPQLREELENCVDTIRQTAAGNHLIDLAMVDELHRCCLYLFDRYEDFSDKERALVIGAVRYFVATEDPLPDDAFSSGFNDDALVMNHVLEQVGAEEMCITVN